MTLIEFIFYTFMEIEKKWTKPISNIRKTYNRIQFPYLHNILDSVAQQFGKCITTTLYFSIYI